jgi:hypothetical protein
MACLIVAAKVRRLHESLCDVSLWAPRLHFLHAHLRPQCAVYGLDALLQEIEGR